MPDRLLAHVRRWARLDLSQGPQAAVIRYKGRPITRQQRGWVAVVKAAGLGTDVTPHLLKHSATTWLLRAGVSLWDISQLTSTSMKTLEAVYGHHSPEFQQAAAKAFRRA
jgi:integrase